MQYDKNNNCHYCGYGPRSRSPNWGKGHSGVCCETHAGEPPEKAKNENEWRKFKRLPQNFGSGQTIIVPKIKYSPALKSFMEEVFSPRGRRARTPTVEEWAAAHGAIQYKHPKKPMDNRR
jgi:hypothetical protein